MNTVTAAILAFCAAAVSAQYGAQQQQVFRVESNSYSSPQQGSGYSSRGYGGQQAVRDNIPITRFSQDISGSQSNNVQFETGNGISLTDNTQVVRGSGNSYNDGNGNQVRSESAIQKQGSFAYTSPEGQQISTSWVADASGFRAQGAHLPRPVEMPAEHAEAHRQANAAAAASAMSSSNYGSSGYQSSDTAVRTSYNAPAQVVRTQSHNAPAQVVRSESYGAPAQAVRASSYNAPAATAPANIRIQSYEAPMRSTGY